jgi:hypothetical protein
LKGGSGDERASGSGDGRAGGSGDGCAGGSGEGRAGGSGDGRAGGSGDGRAGDPGDSSAGGSSEIGDRDWGVSVGGRLSTLLLKADCGIEEEEAGELGMELIGGLVEMRMLTWDSERNIWRIGSFQCVDSNSVEEVGDVGVAVVVGDGLLRFDEGDDGEV